MAITPPPVSPPAVRTPDYYAVKISGAAILVNLIVIALSLLMITIGTTYLGVTILLLQLVHIGLSLRIVLENRLAMLLQLGAYAGDVKPGLIYVLWPVSQLITVTKNMIERDIPDSPENIFHGDLTEETSDGLVPEGSTPALRITFAPPQPLKDGADGYEVTINDPKDRPKDGREPIKIKVIIPKDDAYFRRNTTEVEASFGYCVTNLRLFYEKIGSVDNASQSMNDHAIAGLNTQLPKFTLAEAFLRLDEFASDMVYALTEYSDEWGIKVIFFRFKHPGVSHALNSAVSGVAVASENLKTTRFTAEGIKTTLTETGRGNANSNADMLSSTAQGLRDIAAVAANPGGAYAMTVNAAEKALVAAKTVIVPSNNLFGMIASAADVLKNIPNQPQAGQPDQTPQAETERDYGSTGKYGGKKGKDKK
jgi:regulator of protease activity HflC (stomatin/prohibitin superfamily)